MFIFWFRECFVDVDELRRHHRRLRASLESLAAAKELVSVLALESMLALGSISVLVFGSKLFGVLETARVP